MTKPLSALIAAHNIEFVFNFNIYMVKYTPSRIKTDHDNRES